MLCQNLLNRAEQLKASQLSKRKGIEKGREFNLKNLNRFTFAFSLFRFHYLPDNEVFINY